MGKINEEELEKVPLLIVYKQGDKIYAEQSEEIIDKFQLFGFLKVYLSDFEDRLLEELEE